MCIKELEILVVLQNSGMKLGPFKITTPICHTLKYGAQILIVGGINLLWGGNFAGLLGHQKKPALLLSTRSTPLIS